MKIDMENQIKKLYSGERLLHSYSQENLPKTVSPLYGEITREGVDSVIENLKSYFLDENAVFYDLGSGAGKMVIHVAIQCPIKKSIGVEYIKSRYDHSLKSAEDYTYKSKNSPIFMNEDLSKIYLFDATIVYIDNIVNELRDISHEIYKRLPVGCVFLFRNGVFKLSLPEKDVKTSFEAPTTYMKEGYMMHWAVKS